MTNEIRIVERPHTGGYVPPVGALLLRYDFEITGTTAFVNTAHSMIKKDFEITLDGDKPYPHNGGTSEILCTFKEDVGTAERFNYLLNLERRFKAKFAQQGSVHFSIELLNRYSTTATIDS